MTSTSQDKEDQGRPLCIVMKDDFLRKIVASVLSRLSPISQVLEFRTCQEAQNFSQGMQCRMVLIEIAQAALCAPYCRQVRTQNPGARLVVLAEPEECNGASASQFGADVVVPFTGLLQAVDDIDATHGDPSRLIS